MASSTNRWAEYDAGTLTPPVIVQHDITDPGEHLLWVYTTNAGVVGPFSRAVFVEADVLSDAESLKAAQYSVIAEDGSTMEI